MSKAPDFAAPPPSIKTKAELDRLRDARPAPEAGPQLNMDGPIGMEVRRQVVVANENRVRDLEARLCQAREGLKRDHAVSQVRGKAKGDFGRGR